MVLVFDMLSLLNISELPFAILKLKKFIHGVGYMMKSGARWQKIRGEGELERPLFYRSEGL